MKKFSILLLAIFSLFIFVTKTEAKVLPQAIKTVQKQTVVTKSVAGTGINVSPRLRFDRRALLVYFSNLQNATSVSYTLTYDTSIQPEGAIGSLNLKGTTSASQELLFGTCSKNVCRYHTNISNMRLEVTYISKTGKKYIKRYKIKV